MRALDPRLWNLVPAALLLGSACQTGPQIPIGMTETETSSGDGGITGDGDGDPTDTTDGDGETAGDGDGDSTACNPPCGPHSFCYDGNFCYQIPPDPECGEDGDCPIGEWCDFEEWSPDCNSRASLAECEAPAVSEIPLPEEAQGLTLDLEFVDLDGDELDELLLLKAGELLVVRSDQSVASYVVDAMTDEFAAVRANDDEHLDLVLTSWSPDHAGLLLNNGDGSFAAAQALPLGALIQPHAADWEPGGAGELLALEFDTAVLVSDLAGAVSTQMLEIEGFSNSELVAVHVDDIDNDDVVDVILQRACAISYQTPFGETGEVFVWQGGTPCRSYYEPLGASSEPRLVMLSDIGTRTGIRTYKGQGEFEQDVVISGLYGDLAGVTGLGFVLTGPSGTRVLEPSEQTLDCVASLEQLPPATRVVAGNFVAGPGDEFVLYGQDQLSAWSVP